MEFPNGENACMRDRLFSSVASSWRRDLFLPRESTRQRHESPLLHFSSVGVQTERETPTTRRLCTVLLVSPTQMYTAMSTVQGQTHTFLRRCFTLNTPPKVLHPPVARQVECNQPQSFVWETSASFKEQNRVNPFNWLESKANEDLHVFCIQCCETFFSPFEDFLYI